MTPAAGASERSVPEAEACAHLRALRAYGYSRVEGYLSSDATRTLRELVEHLWESSRHEHYQGRPERDYRDLLIYNLQNKDKRFIDILDAPFLRRVLMERLNDPYYRFLPPEEPNYILGYYNARSSGEKLDLHIDSHIPFPGEITNSMQAAFVLEDHTLDNGCTVVVPGSHLSGRYTDRELERTEPVLANAGDLVLWDSRLWHGTRENRSGVSRWTLVATFTMWWIKQTMDMTRSLPEDIYRRLTDGQKRLLGFCVIPPKDERERTNTKCGYDALKPELSDYYR